MISNFVTRNIYRQPRQWNTHVLNKNQTKRPAHNVPVWLQEICPTAHHEGMWGSAGSDTHTHTHTSTADWWIIRGTGRRRVASHTSPLMYIDTSPLRPQQKYDDTCSSATFDNERAAICCVFCPRKYLNCGAEFLIASLFWKQTIRQIF